MAMPRDLVLIRHGESEANIVQKSFKEDPKAVAPQIFLERHDSRMRLSAKGREQARVTGEYLNKEFKNGFDKYFVSALNRTIETAGCLGINGDWNIDDRWRERDWGELSALNDNQIAELMPLSKMIREQTYWYWCPPGGESLATGVRLRFEDILDSLHRESDGKQVIAVTHGETMSVAGLVLERLTPEQWLERDEDPNYKIPNTLVLHYSRVNPKTGIMSDKLEWRRAICPWDTSKSWFGGEWIKINRAKYSDSDLLKMANKHKLLFD